MVKSNTTSITPAQHAARHSVGGADPLVDPILTSAHKASHYPTGSDPTSDYLMGDIDSGLTKIVGPNPGNNAAAWMVMANTDLTLRGAVPSTVRFSFDLKRNAAGEAIKGRIYRNGVAVGTIREPPAAAYVTYVEDLEAAPDDVFELYGYGSGTNFGWMQNFHIRGYLGFITV